MKAKLKYKKELFKKKKNDFKDRFGTIFYVKDGIPYREDGLPHIVFSDSNKTLQWLSLDKNGNYYVSHQKCTNKQNDCLEFYFNKKSKYSHKDKPSISIWNENNILVFEEYMLDGLTHNINGPAIINRDSRGNVYKEVFYKNGFIHNDNGSSIRQYDIYDSLIYEAYYKDGVLHREDGPAIIEKNVNNKIISEKYYLNGLQKEKEDFELIKNQNLPKIC
jgi:hypothetical protein